MQYENATMPQIVYARPTKAAKPIDKTTAAGQMLALSRKASIEDGMKERQARSKRRTRARAKIVAQIEGIEKAKPTADPDRMVLAWRVVTPLVPMIEQVAEHKGQKARFYLGLLPADVAADVVLEIVEMLARSDKDLAMLALAARAVAGEEVDEPVKGRKFLRQAVHVIINQYLVDAYRRASSSDEAPMTEAVLAQMDLLVQPWENHVATKAPVMLGGHPTAPGSLDAMTLAIVVTEGITRSHLDPMTEFILAHLRTDGTFPWATYAREIFLLDPEGMGVQKWAMVVQATHHHKRPETARGGAAMLFARHCFEGVTALLGSAVQAMQPVPLPPVPATRGVASPVVKEDGLARIARVRRAIDSTPAPVRTDIVWQYSHAWIVRASGLARAAWWIEELGRA